MEPILPSELARLVLGYLYDECPEAAKVFLEKSPLLTECLHVKKQGRRFNTHYLGNSLKDVLEIYCSIHKLVAERSRKLPENSATQFKQITGLTEQLNHLLDSNKSTLLVSITVPSQENRDTGSVKRSRCRIQGLDFGNKPSGATRVREAEDIQAENEAGDDDGLSEVSPRGTGSSTRSSQTDSGHVDNSPFTKPSRACGNVPSGEAVSGKDPSLENIPCREKPGGSVNAAATCSEETCAMLLSASTPKKKGSPGIKKKGLPTPGRSSAKKSQPAEENPLDIHDISDVLAQAMLEQTEIAEKIAANINQMRSKSQTNSDQEKSLKLNMDLDCVKNAIPTIADEIHKDPLFDRILQDILVPFVQANGSDDEEEAAEHPVSVGPLESPPSTEDTPISLCFAMSTPKEHATPDRQSRPTSEVLSTPVLTMPKPPTASCVGESSTCETVVAPPPISFEPASETLLSSKSSEQNDPLVTTQSGSQNKKSDIPKHSSGEQSPGADVPLKHRLRSARNRKPDMSAAIHHAEDLSCAAESLEVQNAAAVQCIVDANLSMDSGVRKEPLSESQAAPVSVTQTTAQTPVTTVSQPCVTTQPPVPAFVKQTPQPLATAQSLLTQHEFTRPRMLTSSGTLTSLQPLPAENVLPPSHMVPVSVGNGSGISGVNMFLMPGNAGPNSQGSFPPVITVPPRSAEEEVVRFDDNITFADGTCLTDSIIQMPTSNFSFEKVGGQPVSVSSSWLTIMPVQSHYMLSNMSQEMEQAVCSNINHLEQTAVKNVGARIPNVVEPRNQAVDANIITLTEAEYYARKTPSTSSGQFIPLLPKGINSVFRLVGQSETDVETIRAAALATSNQDQKVRAALQKSRRRPQTKQAKNKRPKSVAGKDLGKKVNGRSNTPVPTSVGSITAPFLTVGSNDAGNEHMLLFPSHETHIASLSLPRIDESPEGNLTAEWTSSTVDHERDLLLNALQLKQLPLSAPQGSIATVTITAPVASLGGKESFCTSVANVSCISVTKDCIKTSSSTNSDTSDKDKILNLVKCEKQFSLTQSSYEKTAETHEVEVSVEPSNTQSSAPADASLSFHVSPSSSLQCAAPKRQSLSTPRRQHSHVRALDFSTPLRTDLATPEIRKSNTLPKGHSATYGLNSLPRPVKRTNLFKSPPVVNSALSKPVQNACEKVCNETPVSSMTGIATRGPVTKLHGDWDKVTGAGAILSFPSPSSSVSAEESPVAKPSEDTSMSTLDQADKTTLHKSSTWDADLRALVAADSKETSIKRTPKKRQPRTTLKGSAARTRKPAGATNKKGVKKQNDKGKESSIEPKRKVKNKKGKPRRLLKKKFAGKNSEVKNGTDGQNDKPVKHKTIRYTCRTPPNTKVVQSPTKLKAAKRTLVHPALDEDEVSCVQATDTAGPSHVTKRRRINHSLKRVGISTQPPPVPCNPGMSKGLQRRKKCLTVTPSRCHMNVPDNSLDKTEQSADSSVVVGTCQVRLSPISVFTTPMKAQVTWKSSEKTGIVGAFEYLKPGEDTPVTKVSKRIPETPSDFGLINTPSFPPTPNIVMTPEVSHPQASNVCSPTFFTGPVYSSSPPEKSDSETPGKSLELVLIEECRRMESENPSNVRMMCKPSVCSTQPGESCTGNTEHTSEEDVAGVTDVVSSKGSVGSQVSSEGHVTGSQETAVASTPPISNSSTKSESEIQKTNVTISNTPKKRTIRQLAKMNYIEEPTPSVGDVITTPVVINHVNESPSSESSKRSSSCVSNNNDSVNDTSGTSSPSSDSSTSESSDDSSPSPSVNHLTEENQVAERISVKEVPVSHRSGASGATDSECEGKGVTQTPEKETEKRVSVEPSLVVCNLQVQPEKVHPVKVAESVDTEIEPSKTECVELVLKDSRGTCTIATGHGNKEETKNSYSEPHVLEQENTADAHCRFTTTDQDELSCSSDGYPVLRFSTDDEEPPSPVARILHMVENVSPNPHLQSDVVTELSVQSYKNQNTKIGGVMLPTSGCYFEAKPEALCSKREHTAADGPDGGTVTQHVKTICTNKSSDAKDCSLSNEGTAGEIVLNLSSSAENNKSFGAAGIVTVKASNSCVASSKENEKNEEISHCVSETPIYMNLKRATCSNEAILSVIYGGPGPCRTATSNKCAVVFEASTWEVPTGTTGNELASVTTTVSVYKDLLFLSPTNGTMGMAEAAGVGGTSDVCGVPSTSEIVTPNSTGPKITVSGTAGGAICSKTLVPQSSGSVTQDCETKDKCAVTLTADDEVECETEILNQSMEVISLHADCSLDSGLEENYLQVDLHNSKRVEHSSSPDSSLDGSRYRGKQGEECSEDEQFQEREVEGSGEGAGRKNSGLVNVSPLVKLYNDYKKDFSNSRSWNTGRRITKRRFARQEGRELARTSVTATTRISRIRSFKVASDLKTRTTSDERRKCSGDHRRSHKHKSSVDSWRSSEERWRASEDHWRLPNHHQHLIDYHRRSPSERSLSSDDQRASLDHHRLPRPNRRRSSNHRQASACDRRRSPAGHSSSSDDQRTSPGRHRPRPGSRRSSIHRRLSTGDHRRSADHNPPSDDHRTLSDHRRPPPDSRRSSNRRRASAGDRRRSSANHSPSSDDQRTLPDHRKPPSDGHRSSNRRQASLGDHRQSSNYSRHSSSGRSEYPSGDRESTERGRRSPDGRRRSLDDKHVSVEHRKSDGWGERGFYQRHSFPPLPYQRIRTSRRGQGAREYDACSTLPALGDHGHRSHNRHLRSSKCDKTKKAVTGRACRNSREDLNQNAGSDTLEEGEIVDDVEEVPPVRQGLSVPTEDDLMTYASIGSIREEDRHSWTPPYHMWRQDSARRRNYEFDSPTPFRHSTPLRHLRKRKSSVDSQTPIHADKKRRPNEESPQHLLKEVDVDQFLSVLHGPD